MILAIALISFLSIILPVGFQIMLMIGALMVNHHLMDIIRLIFAILLPPVGVFLQVGIGLQFWINILLTIFGYVPGIIHAVYIIVTRD